MYAASDMPSSSRQTTSSSQRLTRPHPITQMPQANIITQRLFGLESDLQRNSSDEIAKVEDPRADIEALADQVELFLHALDLGVADVGSEQHVNYGSRH
jgi:hypothetical protein